MFQEHNQKYRMVWVKAVSQPVDSTHYTESFTIFSNAVSDLNYLLKNTTQV